jgi:hypothetical protein
MKTNSIRRWNYSTRNDVVSIHERTSDWFSDPVNIDRRSSDKRYDETSCSSE